MKTRGRTELRVGRRTALAAAASWPAWIRQAFAEERRACPEEAYTWRWLEIVTEGYRRAQRQGKPLLVLVVPTPLEARWRAGQTFGELLNHGSDEALALLALVETICAPMAPLRQIVPAVPAEEPLMVLIETHVVPARVEMIGWQRLDHRDPEELAAPERVPDDRHWERYFEQREEAGKRLAQARIATLTELLRSKLAADGKMIEARAQLVEARLTPAELARGPANAAAPPLTDAVLLRQAALALRELLHRPQQPALFAALARASRAQLCRRRVPGSRWANSTGCGSDVEYEPGEKHDDGMYACGMGHTPALSRRFLDFLQTDGSWRRL